MHPFAADIERAVEERPERLLELARRAMEVTPDADATRYTDDEIAQFVHAFAAVLLETLRGEGRDARDLLLETAIPALVADGETVASLVRSTMVYGMLMADELAASVPPEHREAATAFLAAFLGGYAADLVEAGAQSSGA